MSPPRRLLLLVLLILGVCAAPAGAAINLPFVQRFAVNDTGDVVQAGNTLETCQAAEVGCAAAQAGGVANNNTFNMGFVDVDGNASTFNSSSATLALPAGATVLYAGLYYGGRTSAGPGGAAAPNAAARSTLALRTPGAGYRTITASTADTGVAAAYAGFADVTGIVRAAGAGVYTTANVQSGTGLDRYAGWALVVAYRDPNAPVRNLTVYDGLATLQQNPITERTLSLPVAGFVTPLSGPVRSTVGIVAYEGDRGSPGDQLTVNGTPLSDAENPANNVFNSTIADRGVRVAGKAPSYENELGFDLDRLGADGIIPNGATSLTLAETTNVEQFFTQVVTLATDLFAPELDVSKRVENLTRPGGPNEPGDTLRYTITVRNSGQDSAAAVAVADVAPPGTTAVPGTPAGLAVGTVAPGASRSVSFDATIDAGVTDGQVITNVATAIGRAQTSGVQLRQESNPVSLAVRVPPPLPLDVHTRVRPAKPDAGDTVSDTVRISNPGPGAVDGVEVQVDVDGPVGDLEATTTRGSCNAGRPVVCRIGRLEPGETVIVKVRVRPSGKGTLRFRTTVRAPGYAVKTSSSSRRVAAAPRRLQVTKRANRLTARRGTRVRWTLVVRVPKGGAPARRVRVCDRLPGRLKLLSAKGAGRHGHTVCWSIHRLLSGGRRTLRLTTRVRSGRLGKLTNVASARAAGLARRRARAHVRVVSRFPAACGSSVRTGPPLAHSAC